MIHIHIHIQPGVPPLALARRPLWPSSMADELVNLLQSIGVSDHDELVKKFAEVLQTEPAAARFFLESSNWNVEQAINTFFSTMGAGGEGLSHVSAPPPEARFLGDASITQSRPFPPGATIHMVRPRPHRTHPAMECKPADPHPCASRASLPLPRCATRRCGNSPTLGRPRGPMTPTWCTLTAIACRDRLVCPSRRHRVGRRS